jgi:hypothetical protein
LSNKIKLTPINKTNKVINKLILQDT